MLYRCNGEPTFAWFETVPTLEILLHHPFLLKALATWQVSFEMYGRTCHLRFWIVYSYTRSS
jgi:hypothetical protein